MNPFPLDGEYGLPLLGPKSPITEQGALDAAAIATSPVPILGDVVGLVADAKRMYDNPAERTPANVILAALGLIPFVPSGALTDKIGRLLGGWHASRNPSIYSPKPLPQRPFEHDYPKPGAAGGDGGSRVAFDIDGRQASPAALIAGRRTVGGDDIGLSRIDQDRAIGLLGIRFESVPRSGPGLKGDLGRYDHANRTITIDKALKPEIRDRIGRHERGHAIDRFTYGDGIPIDGIKKELATIYERQNIGGWFKPGRGATPKTFRYPEREWRAELIAEAIRAYVEDPNWIKSVAPRTAARIREHVNTNKTRGATAP